MTLSTLPPITVLMSVFNGEQWLERSIQSVLTQTFPNFEFIIVNDGSYDATLEIATKYARSDPRIQILNKQNTGLADSLNYGLARARGTWTARLDADDVCTPDRLEKQLATANEDPRLVLIGSGMYLTNDQDDILSSYTYPLKHESLIYCLSHGLPFFPHSSAFLRTEVARNIGGYRPRFLRSQDLDLWLRLSECGNILALRQPLVAIRKHPDQISSGDSGKLQLLFSYSAIVCFWIRKKGWSDPASTLSDSEFPSFIHLVQVRFFRSQLYQSLRLARSLKSSPPSSKCYLQWISSLLESLFKYPLLSLIYLKYRITGTSLPKSIAAEWLSQK